MQYSECVLDNNYVVVYPIQFYSILWDFIFVFKNSTNNLRVESVIATQNNRLITNRWEYTENFTPLHGEREREREEKQYTPTHKKQLNFQNCQVRLQPEQVSGQQRRSGINREEKEAERSRQAHHLRRNKQVHQENSRLWQIVC